MKKGKGKRERKKEESKRNENKRRKKSREKVKITGGMGNKKREEQAKSNGRKEVLCLWRI